MKDQLQSFDYNNNHLHINNNNNNNNNTGVRDYPVDNVDTN